MKYTTIIIKTTIVGIKYYNKPFPTWNKLIIIITLIMITIIVIIVVIDNNNKNCQENDNKWQW